MGDPIFENARLVDIYDAFDGPRSDLDHYLAIVKDLKTRSVVDIGCGTGSFACLLRSQGFDVTGVDPAQASLNIARKKPYADQIHWILGDAVSLPALNADLAVMTGNVAQVFLTDDAWKNNLAAIRRSLHDGGHLVFEVRDPAQQAWLKWTKEKTYKRINIPNIGFVEGWCDVTSVSDKLISFRWTYAFEADGQTLHSDSTLCFRSKEEITRSLEQTGFVISDIREAPDRPQQEFVFIAKAI